jgi:hypothetical protein
MSKCIGRLLLIVVIALGAGLFAAPVSTQAATCSGTGCNYTDPVTTGCSSSAFTARTAYIGDSTIELRYSKSCGTNWSRYTSGSNYNVIVYVERYDGEFAYDTTSWIYSSNRYSDQLYTPTTLARACAYIDYSGPYCTSWA